MSCNILFIDLIFLLIADAKKENYVTNGLDTSPLGHSVTKIHAHTYVHYAGVTELVFVCRRVRDDVKLENILFTRITTVNSSQIHTTLILPKSGLLI